MGLAENSMCPNIFKSLMRMFSVSGNPTANNLFEVIHILQEKEGVHYELQAVR